MSTMGDSLMLRDGRALSSGSDAEGNWITLTTTGRPEEVVRLPKWTGGVGGMELVLSPDERHVALFIYSGQSSLGFETFSCDSSLQRIGGMAEIYGHGSAPVFSPAGRWLATCVDQERRVRGTGEFFEEAQDDDSSEVVVVDWARLCVQELSAPAVHSFALGVELPLRTDLDTLCDWDRYDLVTFTSDDVVSLRMPWGETLVVTLPVTEPIIARGFLGLVCL